MTRYERNKGMNAYSETKEKLDRILEVFDKYDKTNIPADYSETPLVDLVTADIVSLACYFSSTDGSISASEAEVFNAVFGVSRTPEEITALITDDESIIQKIGTTFNVIAETEKRLGIYSLRKTMIVPLIKFFERFAMDVIRSDEYDKSELDTYNIFFCKIEAALTAIPPR